MKKLFFLALLIASTFNGYSTHLMGGEIVVLNDSQNSYYVLLTLYRDTIGIDISATQDFAVTDSQGNVVANLTSTIDSSATHPIFGTVQGGLMPMFPYGVEIYFYSVSINLPNPGEYTVSWESCCRNEIIGNITNASSENMSLHTTFTNDVSQNDSSPYFLVKPVVYLPVNTPWQYNPLPIDPDGDSLNWFIGTPNNALGTPIATYVDPPSDPSNVLSMDPVSGTITWTASVTGNWVYTIVCEEFRGGIKIGEIRRDMQVIVVPSGSLPSFSNIGTVVPIVGGYPQWSIPAGQNSELRLLGSNPGTSNSLLFEAYGEPFLSTTPAVYSQDPTGFDNEIEAIINWNPSSNDVRDEPYLTVLRLMDGFFMNDEAIFIQVVSGVNVENNSRLNFSPLYPNPSNGTIHIPITIDQASNVELKIFNLYGQLVYSNIDHFNAGESLAILPTSLKSGQYYVIAEMNGKRLSTHDVIIVK